MNVLRHHHVSDDRELVPLAHVIENDEKHVARACGSQKWQAPVTTEGDEIEVRGSVAAFEIFGHELDSRPEKAKTETPRENQNPHPLHKPAKGWGTRYPVHSDVLDSKAVEETRGRYGTYFLSSAYPEGALLHPSYPQAHATIAGACATLLKAAFDGTVQFNTLRPIQIARDDGLCLLPYTESDANQITVNGEINKLASNIGMARNFAGVHWRSDYSEGLKLGEAVAISLLRDQERLCRGENFSGFKLTKFDGTTISI